MFFDLLTASGKHTCLISRKVELQRLLKSQLPVFVLLFVFNEFIPQVKFLEKSLTVKDDLTIMLICEDALRLF